MAEWLGDSRLRGVLRYHYKRIGKLVVWALLLLVGVHVLALLTPYLDGDIYTFDGIRSDFVVVFFGALIAGILTAGGSSRFLLRFGTARTPVWLGNVLSLFVSMVVLLLGTFVLNMAFGALMLPLSQAAPQAYGMGGYQFGNELAAGLRYLPRWLLFTLEWTSIFYFYACMLRRFKALTISLSVGIPLLFIIMMLIPAVREAISVVQGNNQSQILVLGLQWLQMFNDILRFIEDHWDAVQLTAGIISLPCSYLVMRGTKQP